MPNRWPVLNKHNRVEMQAGQLPEVRSEWGICSRSMAISMGKWWGSHFKQHFLFLAVIQRGECDANWVMGCLKMVALFQRFQRNSRCSSRWDAPGCFGRLWCCHWWLALVMSARGHGSSGNVRFCAVFFWGSIFWNNHILHFLWFPHLIAH